jgi:hypothetical protein
LPAFGKPINKAEMKHSIAALTLIIGCLSGLNAQRKLPFRIAPYEKNNFRNCLEKGGLGCRLDTMEYSGVSGEFNFMSAWALGKYRKSGNRGTGLGFGLSFAYQPLRRIPLNIHGDFGFLYTDLRNQDAVVQVFPTEGNLAPIPYPVRSNIKNELFLGNIGLRYWLPTRYWQPYGMAGIGFINHNTLLRLYDDDEWVIWGTSDRGLLLESRINHKWYGSRFVAAGISYNAGYSLNLDFRFTLIQSQKFKYQSLKLPDEWSMYASQTDGSGNPAGFEAESGDLFNPQQAVPFNMLMFSFSLTAFFE